MWIFRKLLGDNKEKDEIYRNPKLYIEILVNEALVFW